MEWVGWMCLIILLCYSSYPNKVKKLESKVTKLERKQKGESQMSKIITGLIGETCKIKTEEALFFADNTEVECKVIDADDEWIKFTYCDKKQNMKTKILRIDSIENIELITE